MNEKELSIIDILIAVWAQKFLVLTLVILGMIISFVNVTYFTDFSYKANGTLFVSNQTQATIQNETISKSDIESSRTLSSTYMEILKTRSFLIDVSKKCDNKYSWKDISKMMSISAINETELLSISITAPTPEDALKIADCVIIMAPDKLTSVFKRGEVEIVDVPIFPSEPVSKGRIQKIAIGGMLGLVISVGIAMLLLFLDKKIHKGVDIVERYNISFLGEIDQYGTR